MPTEYEKYQTELADHHTRKHRRYLLIAAGIVAAIVLYAIIRYRSLQDFLQAVGDVFGVLF